ncbi:hypothetical protein ACIBG7_18510 [Nonomuraea sp. NPDC050328]|uniref:hypothetical protein n=1 Tax=Nonomuraea sp. NPDC050328 TaxID=3364361 RepID=UPI00379846ED
MSHPRPADTQVTTPCGRPSYGPCFTTSRPPLPYGCGICGHAPYEHGPTGCGSVPAHEYVTPGPEQVAARWDLLRAAGIQGRHMPATEWLPPVECVPAAPAQPAEPDLTPVEEQASPLLVDETEHTLLEQLAASTTAPSRPSALDLACRTAQPSAAPAAPRPYLPATLPRPVGWRRRAPYPGEQLAAVA